MSKFVLSVNAGSSSLKFQLFDMPSERCIIAGQFDAMRSEHTQFKVKFEEQKWEQQLAYCDFDEAVVHLINYLTEQGIISAVEQLGFVGHRVAHGGDRYCQSVIIDAQVKHNIAQLSKLAPIHNPINLACIEAFQAVLSKAVHVAVFDTAFHQSIKKDHYLYPLPYELYEQYDIRKFGFHGISHQYISTYVAECLSAPNPKRIISCHLGSGASICAIKEGKSVTTSMGFTPLAGLMMGTRCGDIDPALPFHLVNSTDMSMQQVNDLMNNESGLLGVSKVSNDLRAVEEAAYAGNIQAQLALQMFANRVRETIGAYATTLEGVDLLVFTGGIGENSTRMRELIVAGLSFMGITISLTKNADNHLFINDLESNVQVMVINTNEELMIAREVLKLTTVTQASEVRADAVLAG